MSVADDVRQQITKRLKELKPLVDEYHQLEAMVRNLATRGWRFAVARSQLHSRPLHAQHQRAPPRASPREQYPLGAGTGPR